MLFSSVLSCLPGVHLPVQITVATSMTLRVGSTAEQTFNAVERVQVGAASLLARLSTQLTVFLNVCRGCLHSFV
jgi:hypothetical protein